MEGWFHPGKGEGVDEGVTKRNTWRLGLDGCIMQRREVVKIFMSLGNMSVLASRFNIFILKARHLMVFLNFDTGVRCCPFFSTGINKSVSSWLTNGLRCKTSYTASFWRWLPTTKDVSNITPALFSSLDFSNSLDV